MTNNFRKTVRSFLSGEQPGTRDDALKIVHEWFDRYDPDPKILAEEVDRYFAGEDGPHSPDHVLTGFRVAV